MSTRLQLTPTPTNYAGVELAYVPLTGYTGVTWNSSGREILLVNVGATATVITGNIGITVLGQTVTAESWTPAVSNVTAYGLFPSAFNQPGSGTNAINIDFSSVTAVTVMLLQIQGVS